MSIDNLSVFSGNANPELAAQVVDYLKLPLGKAKVEQFSDGEITLSKYSKRMSVAATYSSSSQPAHPAIRT